MSAEHGVGDLVSLDGQVMLARTSEGVLGEGRPGQEAFIGEKEVEDIAQQNKKMQRVQEMTGTDREADF